MAHRPLVPLLVLGLVAATLGVAGPVSPAAAEPATVTIAGSFQQELGCPGDWQPECAATHLTLDADDGVWQAQLRAPGRDLGVQGGARRHVGRELRRRRRARRAEHRPRRSAGPSHGQVLLRRRDPLGHRQPDVGDRHRAGQLPERARLRQPTGTRAACGRGCRTPTATASAGSRRRSLPPGDLRGQGRDRRGVGRELRRRRRPDGANIPFTVARRGRRRHVQLRPAQPRARHRA